MESHTRVPYFIEAKDKIELVKKMIQNNVKKGSFVNYFNITQEKPSKWSVWYYEELSNMIKLDKPEEKKPSLSKTRNKNNV